MKKLLLFLICFFSLHYVSSAQPKLKINGNLIVASDIETTLIGLPGPKLTLSPKFKTFRIELGVIGVPSMFLVSGKIDRLGLAGGPIAILSGLKTGYLVIDGKLTRVPGEGKKGKLMVAFLFTKSGSEWKFLPGIGWIF